MKKRPDTKHRLHPRNRHRGRYDFEELMETCTPLSIYVRTNEYGDDSIDFFDPKAVKMLNRALLMHHYGLKFWDIPDGYLCPPIPGRADYLHYMADVLAKDNRGEIPVGPRVRVLDIGTGANMVYPIIGVKEFGWSFVGTETDPVAMKNAQEIVAKNLNLQQRVEIRLQEDEGDIFWGMMKENEYFELVVCNPPFHGSAKEAEEASKRKVRNLKGKTGDAVTLNFGGRSTELWRPGGEEKFLADMVRESAEFAENCLWFSSLVSKHTTLKPTYERLREANAVKVKTIPMGQGQKSSRILAWSFGDDGRRAGWFRK